MPSRKHQSGHRQRNPSVVVISGQKEDTVVSAVQTRDKSLGQSACPPKTMTKEEATKAISEFHRKTEADLQKAKASGSEPQRSEAMDAKTKSSLLL